MERTINEIYKEILEMRDKAKERYDVSCERYKKQQTEGNLAAVLTTEVRLDTLDNVIEMLETSGVLEDV